jgi:hypothetical protein
MCAQYAAAFFKRKPAQVAKGVRGREKGPDGLRSLNWIKSALGNCT